MAEGANLGTWRKQIVSVPAKALVTVEFTDTTPNYFFLVNAGATSCYVGLNNIPNTAHYDMEVKAASQRMICDFHGYKKIYLYNDGTADITVTVKSFTWEFNPLVLAQMESATTSGGDSGTTFDGIIKGFTASLPTGANLIGSVNVASSLPAGANTIGNVNVNGTVTPSRLTGTAASGTATTTAAEIFASAVVLSFFSNDGTTSVYIGKAAGACNLEIKAGEALSDVPWIGPLYAKTNSDSVSYRAVAGA